MMNREEVRERAKNVRVIALDMDGTSMNSKSEITPHTRAVIGRLVNQGYLVVPATGRAFHRLRENLIRVDGIRYVISANGAVITDGETGQQIAAHRIPRELAADLSADLLRPDTCMYIHRDDRENTHVFACGDGDLYEAHYRRPHWPGKETLPGMEFPELIRRKWDDIVKIGVWFKSEEKLHEAADFLKENYPQVSAFRAADYELEISDSRASKGNALQTLCERLGISPGEVCAIGDNGNDVSMLRYAGLGVAMGNALAEVKAQADYIAGLNDEEGAAKFFEAFFLAG